MRTWIIGSVVGAFLLAQDAPKPTLSPEVRERVRDATTATLGAENAYLRALLAAEEAKAALLRAIEQRKAVVADALKAHPGCTVDGAGVLTCSKAEK